MTGNMNSRLWRPLTRLHPLLIILAALAVFTLAIAPVNAAPRQQTVDNVCTRTPEVQTAIIARLPGAACSTITDTQLAAITELRITGYSSASILPGDFAGLMALTRLEVIESPLLTTVPANAFSEVATSLTLLHLRLNAISSVDATAFAGLSSLTEINLSYNRIESLHKDTFEGLMALTSLYLNYNSITSLHKDLFKGLTALSELKFESNHIKVLEDGIFNDTTALKRLFLQHNRISILDEDTFKGLANLEDISLPFNRVSWLHEDTFKDLTSLKRLIIHDNRISSLPAGIFHGPAASLDGLYLSGNSILSLDEDIFDGLGNLTTLDLQVNKLSLLPANLFDETTKLEVLQLHSNSIESLPEDIFGGLTALTTLYLSYNSLSSLPSDLFQGLTALSYLYLNNNGITSPPEALFGGLTALTTLFLQNNSMASPPEGLFSGLTALTTLYLHRNSIASLDADTFDGLTALSQLALSYNSLSSLPTDLFQGLTALSYLYLNNNGMASPHEDLFDGLTSLSDLYLSNNGIASPPEDLFDGLSSLYLLDLSNNVIASPPEDLFDGLSSLYLLYLSNNGITLPHVDLFDTLVGLSTLDLSGNAITGLTTGVFEDLDDSLTSLYLRSNELASLPVDIFDGLTGLTGLDLSCNALTALDLTRFDPFATTLTFLEISGNRFTTPPAETALRAKLTNVGYLYTGANTLCGPPNDTGTSEVSISPGSYPTGAVAAMVAHDVSTTTITITARDPNAIIEPYPANLEPLYDDDPSTPGWQVKLPSYRNSFQWHVRAKNGFNTVTGGIVVLRANPPASETRLHSLELSGLTLAETFDNGTQTYMATAAAGVTETTVTATPLDPDATRVIKLNDTEDADGTVELNVGENPITVEVIAEDGSTMRTYTVTVMVQGTVSFGSYQYSVSEGDEVEVTVELSHALPGNASITFPLTKIVGDALPDEYAVPDSITFGANKTSASFTVTATQDTLREDDEYFIIYLEPPTQGEDVVYGHHELTVINIVNDDSPMTVTPRTLDVDEGSTATYTVKLKTVPTGNVAVAISSNDPGAATVSPEMLTFTPTDWSTAKTVTVMGVEDSDQFDEIVRLSNDPSGADYDSVSTVYVALTVADNDRTGVHVSKTSLTVQEEDTAGNSYTVALSRQPTADVTVTVAGHAGTDVTPSPATLTFTSQNWATAQTVTVTAGNDADTVDDRVSLTHSAMSADSAYNGITIASVAVTVTDNDGIGVHVSKTSLTVREGDTAGDSYTVALSTQPTANVTVTVAGHTGTDVTLSPTTLTFTSQNWETAQTVTVKAGDDDDMANDSVTLTHSVASTDTDYQGITISSVAVTVTDNDRTTPPVTGGGGFGAAFEAPQFVDGFRTSRPLEENARPGDAVGDPVAATHPQNSEITYSLSGTDAARFTVDEETGQIRLGQAITLALGQTYTVNLTGTDSGGTGAIIIVDIVVAEAAFHRYDLNKNGSIEKDEVLAAVADYFAARIEKPLVLEVVSLYFAA